MAKAPKKPAAPAKKPKPAAPAKKAMPAAPAKKAMPAAPAKKAMPAAPAKKAKPAAPAKKAKAAPKPKPPKMLPFFDSAEFNWEVPDAGSTVFVGADGTVQVRVKRLGAATSFRAKIYADGTVPADPTTDAGFITLNQEGTSLYYSANVPVGFVALADTRKSVVVVPNSGDWGQQDFIAKAKSTYVLLISALNSLWFAYAPTGYPQRPSGREVGEIYRPQPLIVPTDASTVSIAASADLWRHGDPADPQYTSNADGTAWSSDLNPAVKDEYKGPDAAHDDLKSMNIFGMDLPHNKLVGMWGREATDIGESGTNKLNSEFAVGLLLAGRPVGTVPMRATLLFLAMHDSWEWSNNSGEVKVTVTWAV